MYARIREHFGATALILSIFAMVFAMLGGAYAASHSQQSKKAKTGKRGPKGPAGPQGIPGSQGPAGPVGAAGTKGEKGDPGAGGGSGAAGKSVLVEDATLAECSEGGIVVEEEDSGDPKKICAGAKGQNGVPGAPGPEGSPWTAGGVLPPGKAETGAWSFNAGNTAGEKTLASISYPIPLDFLPAFEQVHFQTDSDFATQCPGIPIIPLANPGQLCVYSAVESNGDALLNASFKGVWSVNEITEEEEEEKSGPSGAVLLFSTGSGGEKAHGYGSWAVKAPCGDGEEEVEEEVPHLGIPFQEMNCQPEA